MQPVVKQSHMSICVIICSRPHHKVHLLVLFLPKKPVDSSDTLITTAQTQSHILSFQQVINIFICCNISTILHETYFVYRIIN